MKYLIKLLSKDVIAKDTMLFTFEKPAGFSYQAGHHAGWTLINPSQTDAEGNSRDFSLVSAPFEETLSFTSRMRPTAFKNSLKDMPLGAEIEFHGPEGDFTLPKNSDKPIVLLAGGIGITPFMSMIKEATHDKSPTKIFLFYSNHAPADTAFLTQLQDLEKQNPNFKFIPTMTALTNEDSWTGEVGHIDGPLLQKHLNDLITKSLYYLAGPPAMVAAIRQTLAGLKVSSDQIQTEEFTGY